MRRFITLDFDITLSNPNLVDPKKGDAPWHLTLFCETLLDASDLEQQEMKAFQYIEAMCY